MSVSRVVCWISKSLWEPVSPRVKPVLWAPCRAITTNKDNVKFGLFGGKKKVIPVPDPTKELDIFLGKWIKQGEGDKSYITYTRHNDAWSMEICNVLGHLRDRFYFFRLGKVFYVDHEDQTSSRILVYQEENHMRWQLQSEFGVANITHILMEVKDDKLVWTIVPPDQPKSIKHFVRP